MDFDKLNAAALPRARDILTRVFPAGVIIKNEFKIGDISGKPGKSLSFNLDTGMWADFAADIGGRDIISLLAKAWGVNNGEAAKRLEGDIGEATAPAPPPKPTQKLKPMVPLSNPDGKYLKNRLHEGLLPEIHVYRSIENIPLYCVLRYDTRPDKYFIPYCYGEFDGITGWHWKAWPSNRPLYRLQHLGKADPALNIVIITEGERKCAKLGAALEGLGYITLTWQGGSNAVNQTDWRPLKGYNVILWPDNDKAGIDSMRAVANKLSPLCGSVRTLSIPPGTPPKFDAADIIEQGITGTVLQEYILENLKEPIQDQPPLDIYNDMPDGEPDNTPAPQAKEAKPIRIEGIEAEFKCLGFTDDRYYFFSYRLLKLMHMSSTQFTKPMLFALMPKGEWDWRFPGRTTLDIDKITEYLISRSAEVGPYNPDNVRGRGAWSDGKSVVLNTGRHLIVDGEPTDYRDHKSKYVYSSAVEMHIPTDNPLSNKQANKFITACKKLSWAKPINGELFAGWCIIAPVCGALKWRPHIWLTSAAGGGKTWVLNHIVGPVLGDTKIVGLGGTTEAGLRQKMRNDARPVVFDEAESLDSEQMRVMQNVLGMARQSSSDGGGSVIKGSTNNNPVEFSMKSCFCYASINPVIRQTADETRTTVLNLEKKDDEMDKFNNEIAPEFDTLLTEEYCASLLARTIKHLPSLRANALMFAKVAAKKLRSARVGDQIGALLAGAYMCHGTSILTEKEAMEFIEKRDWSDHEDITELKDEDKLLNHLSSTKLKVVLKNQNLERTIAELINIFYDPFEVDLIKDVRDTLYRHGIRVEEEHVLISNTSPSVKKMLLDTPWEGNWKVVLKRLEGAEPTEDPVRFGDSAKSQRATLIPKNHFL